MNTKRACTILGENHEVIVVSFKVEEFWGYKVAFPDPIGTTVDGSSVILTEQQRLKALQAAGSVIASQPQA